MAFAQMSALRFVTITLILFAILVVIVLYLPLLTLVEKGSTYLASLNITTQGIMISWSLNDSHFAKQSERNKNIKTTQDLFLQKNTLLVEEKEQVRDTNVTILTRLLEISELVKVAGINCTSLFNGSGKDKAVIPTKSKSVDTPTSDIMYINLTTDCVNFQRTRGYIMSSLTEEEEDFPLAYSMLVYKDAEMVERLLRAIYRPQNYYCIHVDQKAPKDFFNAAFAIAKCFPNIFIASRRVSVWWGKYSVLEPELICMEDLWKYTKWKYFINLTGQEFPLKTNFEIVKIFQAFRGASDVVTLFKCATKKRWRGKHPPYGLRPAKGSVHIAVNRIFVDYILHNKTAKDVLEWTKGTGIPDETFFAILNSNPNLGIKGTYSGEQDGCDKRPTVTRYKMWRGMPCAGKVVRDLCILSIGDLPRLTTSNQLFANKFFLNQDRTVIGCLEEKIFNDTRDEYLGVKSFDTTYYSNLDYVKHQVT